MAGVRGEEQGQERAEDGEGGDPDETRTVALAKASRTARWAAGDRGSVAPVRAGSRPLGTWVPRWAASFNRVARPVLSSGPKTATPKAVPVDRAKVTTAPAAPMSRAGTEFCTAVRTTSGTMPSPTPVTGKQALSTRAPVPVLTVLSNSSPATLSTLPVIRIVPTRAGRAAQRPASD
ncbi:hypothetical protein AB0J21_30530 [Streptomyces sp. NPDC049954]|uniref:hypothetical protein n=1 Tax=Streptomyces sp. NPDC049954 TaxID=3155779 RepID=UPI003414B16E